MNDSHSDSGLLERHGELDLIAALAEEALRGEGRIIAISGDAGAGKSSVVRIAASRQRLARVVTGTCDALSTPRPLGPIRDILRDHGGPDRRVELPSALVDVCELLLETLSAEPTVVVVEDAQWIDEGSADALRFVAKRVEALPVLVLITYRTDEIAAGHALRSLLGDLARSDRASAMTLRPLSEEAVRSLIGSTSLDPVEVHRITGGNPFFVTEVARHPEERIPASVRDAILASARPLTPDDMETLQIIACAPDGVDARLLVQLEIGLPVLRRLESTGLLVQTRQGVGFRHELARQAIVESLPPGAGAAFHSRLLSALEAAGSRDYAVLTHHAVAADDHARTTKYALQAAEEAVRGGAHLEAVSFLSQAADHFAGPPAELGAILEQLSFQQYMVNHLDEAFVSVGKAMEFSSAAGDFGALASAHERRAVFAYYSARRAEAERHSQLALEAAEQAHDDVRTSVASATKAFLAFRRLSYSEASASTSRAGAIAARLDVRMVARQCAIINSASGLMAGDTARRGDLLANIDAAAAESFDELASMGFTNLAGIDVEQRRFRNAEELLERSIPFAVERSITLCRATQTGVRSRMQLLRGRWEAALEDAHTVLDANWAPIARVWPHLTLGVIGLRRGEASDNLNDAWRLACDLDEPHLMLAVSSALAERTWLTEQADPRVAEAANQLPELSRIPGLEWSAGEFAAWLDRIGIAIPGEVLTAEPYRLMRAGRPREAAAAWRKLGAPFDEALALLGSDDESDQVAAIVTFDAMGATATADRARQELRSRGVANVPPRPRNTTRSNPAGLTNRQLEVARLMAQGLTNAELAQRLFISEKTADHHVSAVLGKLGLASRREVVRRAAEFGLD